MFSQTPWPQGTECVARYNFKGTSEQDLPFNKGDVLTIIVVTKVMFHMLYLCPLKIKFGFLVLMQYVNLTMTLIFSKYEKTSNDLNLLFLTPC